MAIKIPFLAEVSSFIRGMRDSGASVDDLAGDLDELARDGERAGDKIYGSFEGVADQLDDVGDDAKSAADKLERSFKDALDEVRDSSRRAGDDLGDNIKRGANDAEDAVGDFKSEAASTARETAASFDGSAESIGDAFQEVAANALGAFGPLGAAAGLALAVGFGALTAQIQQGAEETEQRVSDMYADMIESGELFLSKSFVQQSLADIFGKVDGAAISWANLQATVEATGLSVETVARAYAGDAEAGAQLTAAFNTKLAEQAAAADAAAESGKRLGSEYYAVNQQTTEAVDLWRAQGAQIDDARTRTEAYQSAAVAAGVASVTSAAEAQAQYDGLGRTISELPDPTIKATVDLADAERAINDFVRKPRFVGIGVSAYPGAPQVV